MSIEYAQGWDDAKAQVTTDNSQTLVNALVEIERLNDRLLMVEAILAGNGALITGLKADIDRKYAALRVALDALKGAPDVDRVMETAITTISEALA